VKRTFDIALSLIGLVFLLPLLVVLAICIKLDSPGPVFYRGVRGGRFGTPFRILKLRTMVARAEQLGGAETRADDPRITRVGAVLRYYKLDELPQLINVVLGDMSLVGPRPEVMNEVALYNDRERQLLLARPGITDWASIKFRHEAELLRGSPDVHAAYHSKIRPEKIRLGIEYVQHHSLLIDCKIILATLRAIFQRSTLPPSAGSSEQIEAI
jgi:lipopolysaccharide/colanic/teichoic acid biosynthesis glycosyltransferase